MHAVTQLQSPPTLKEIGCICFLVLKKLTNMGNMGSANIGKHFLLYFFCL